MPKDPRIYTTQNQPPTAEQGDLLFDPSNNTLRVYTGASWVQARFTSLTLTDAASEIVPGATSFAIRNTADNANNLLVVDAGDVTTGRGLWPNAGFASTNAAVPGWYIPGEAGTPTGAIASLGKRVALYYDTTNNRLWFRHGGSYYATASLVLGG